MPIAYVLIKTDPNKDKEVFKKIKKLDKIKEIIAVYGEYDVIIKVETGSFEELDDFVFNDLRPITGVKATTTLLGTKLKT
jgi:DNA-binding Lrp family transcriptional regulator